MKKPHWFRWIDLVTLAGPGLLVAGLTIYAMKSGHDGGLAGVALLWVVAATFFAIWAKFAYERKQWLERFVWAPKWGVMLFSGGYNVDVKIVDEIIDHAIDSWSASNPVAFERKKIVELFKSHVLWVWFIEDLAEEPRRFTGNRKLEGYTVVNGYDIAVDYDSPDQPLTSTSFEHEVGHFIQGHITRDWDQETHHQRAKAFGLR